MNDLKEYLKTACRIIVGVVLTIMILLCLFGCRTQKESTQTKVEVGEEKRAETIQNDIHFASVGTLGSWWTDSLLTHTHVVIRVYDTEKEKDPETGKYPLKMETEISQDQEQKTTGGEERKDTTIFADTTTITQSVEKSDSVSESATKIVKRGSDRFIWFDLFGALLCLGIGVIGAFYLYFKNR